MAFDAHKNLAITTVATAPAPATSGTSVTVAVGEGARFPVAPFNATVWPVSALPTPVNAEVVRVTARTGDVLTITRAQEGTTARSIIAGDFIAETITAKALTDLESGTNFPLITTPGTVTSGGEVIFSAANGRMRMGTADGADSGFIQICGGGAALSTRGALLNVQGNEAGGNFYFLAGDVAGGGTITFLTGPDLIRGVMHRSGGFVWGGTADPGAGVLLVAAGGTGVGAEFLQLANGCITCSGAGTATFPARFNNANGQVGYIGTSGSTTQYSTTSDARLKTSQGRHTDPDVLRRTVIHDFTWKTDGTPGRGVFAQEAASVLPCAVSVEMDEVDAEGRLSNPWGVDYSKYVPDLITGWQDHDEKIDQLLAAVETNVALVERLTAVARRPSIYQRLREAIAVWLPAWITP